MLQVTVETSSPVSVASLKAAVVMAGGTDRGIAVKAPRAICGWLRLTCSHVIG